jgi:hypothetical protein
MKTTNSLILGFVSLFGNVVYTFGFLAQTVEVNLQLLEMNPPLHHQLVKAVGLKYHTLATNWIGATAE